MNDEDEERRCRLLHAIEHEDRLDGKVPRAGTIGRGDKHGEGAHHEGHECSQRTKVGGEVEAEESEIEV